MSPTPPTMALSSDLHPDTVPLTESIQGFLLRELESVRLEIEAYPEEGMIWAMPAGMPNSGGTLVLHLAGNLRHYIGAVLGRTGYVRDRVREFAARDIARATLREELAAAADAIRSTLPHLSEDDLASTYPEAIGGHLLETREMLLQLAVHLAYHLGQLSYHRRVVAGDPKGVGALGTSTLTSAQLAPAPPAAGKAG